MSRPSEDTLGVALTKCYFCGGSGTIVMNTRLTTGMAAKVKEMDGKVLDMTPCNECEAIMKRAVILITIDDAKSDKDWQKEQMPNPYRTGGWFGVSDDYIKRVINPPELAAWALKHRWMFIEHEAAQRLGLFEATPTETRAAPK